MKKGKISEDLVFDREQRAKRIKRQRRLGKGKGNKVWLRTRHRVRNRMLR